MTCDDCCAIAALQLGVSASLLDALRAIDSGDADAAKERIDQTKRRIMRLAADLGGKGQMTCDDVDMVLGARMSMRGAARQILEAIDDLTEHEMRAAGWSREDIAILERIAAWKIEGMSFGDWPVRLDRSADPLGR